MTPPPNIRIVTDGDARVQGSGEHDFGGSWGPLPSSGHLRTRGKCWTCSSGRAGDTDLPLDREALVTAPTGHGVASNLASITPARLWTRYNSREVVSIALVETKCMRRSLFRYPPTVEWNFSSNPASAITRDAAMPFPYFLIVFPSRPIACGRVLTSPMAKGRGLPE